MPYNLPFLLDLSLLNFATLAHLSSFLPGVTVGAAAVAMAISHRRPQTAVLIGIFAMAGIAVGTVLGFLFLSTPEAAGRSGGAAMQAGIIAASIWEMARKPRAG